MIKLHSLYNTSINITDVFIKLGYTYACTYTDIYFIPSISLK